MDVWMGGPTLKGCSRMLVSSGGCKTETARTLHRPGHLGSEGGTGGCLTSGREEGREEGVQGQ